VLNSLREGHRFEPMFEAIALVVGAVIAWVAADRWWEWRRQRQEDGPSSWHGRGPGATFHSTGFEDTVPPHEATAPRPLSGRRPSRQAR
jgi:hypothetical protein